MNTRLKLLFVSITLLTSLVGYSQQAVTLTQASEVKWQPLNPARGAQSPQAGVLWGDLQGTDATGFLVEFKEGFASPDHIHNVSYRGVVISGRIHNDDPNAENMWMPAGSFWTQPAGEAHITAAEGSKNIAYIEIDQGPYLVKPTNESFDNGERPVNLTESNLVWLDASITTWAEATPELDAKPQVSFLWGNLEPGAFHGEMIKLPAGFSGEIIHDGNTFRAVVIGGQLSYQNKDETVMLEPGSLIRADTRTSHVISTHSESPSVVYVRSNGKLTIRESSNASTNSSE